MKNEKTRALERVFHRAVARGDVAQVKDLITAGVDIDVEDDKGNTALYLLARSRHDGLLTTLMEARADKGRRSC